MPIDGFVTTTLFFQQLLSRLVDENIVSPVRIDELRAMLPEKR
jgi:hypothetical protein